MLDLPLVEDRTGRQDYVQFKRSASDGTPDAPAAWAAPFGSAAHNLPGIIFMKDAGGIAVELGRRHDPEVAVAGLKNGNADHEGRREIPCPRVSGFDGLRHCPTPV